MSVRDPKVNKQKNTSANKLILMNLKHHKYIIKNKVNPYSGYTWYFVNYLN